MGLFLGIKRVCSGLDSGFFDVGLSMLFRWFRWENVVDFESFGIWIIVHFGLREIGFSGLLVIELVGL